MLYIRLILVAVVLTIISWLVFKLIRKPINIGWVFLFWVLAIFVSTALLYGLSVWFASS